MLIYNQGGVKVFLDQGEVHIHVEGEHAFTLTVVEWQRISQAMVGV